MVKGQKYPGLVCSGRKTSPAFGYARFCKSNGHLSDPTLFDLSSEFDIVDFWLLEIFLSLGLKGCYSFLLPLPH